MTGMEIVLLILGIMIFAASFLIPGPKQEINTKALEDGEEKVKEIVDEQMKTAKENLQTSVDETLTNAVEKTERSLERISNEKITAVSEFSNTVLEDIHKGHQEIMFLYDMLHEKQKNVLETAKEIERARAIAKETKDELESTVQEAANMEVQEAAAMVKAEAPQASDVSEADSDGTFPKDTEGNGAGEETNNNEKILEMHRQGKSNVAIARELGLGVGEVNLVIDLFEVM